LWSDHDDTHHHRRRYGAKKLRTLLRGAGLDVTYLSYYNFMLFPMIAGARILQRLQQRNRVDVNGRHDLTMPSPSMNAILRRIFSSERHLIGRARVPLGVSLIVVARAPVAADSVAIPIPSVSAN